MTFVICAIPFYMLHATTIPWAKSPEAVHVKINVLPLWKDSDIMVDGKVVEPLERVGTYFNLGSGYTVCL